MRRVKAVFWWCYLHSEFKRPEAEMLRTMKTDAEVEGLFALASQPRRNGNGAPDEYSSGVDWNEFHTPTEYRQ